MEENNPNTAGGLPTWAKVLIGLFIAGLLVGAAMIGGLVYFGSNFAKKATNPADIAKVSEKIGAFPTPLPGGFHWTYGFEMAGIDLVSTMHAPDNTQVNIRRAPNPQKLDAQQALSKQLEIEPLSDVTQRGEESVAGQKMLFAIGTSGTGPTKIQHLTGVITPNNNSSIVVVTGLTPGDSYNMAATKEFLSGIKSFN